MNSKMLLLHPVYKNFDEYIKNCSEPLLIGSSCQNPEIIDLANRIAFWENKEKAVVVSSGHLALWAAIISHVHNGEHLIAHHRLSAQSELLLEYLPELGIRIDRLDCHNINNLHAAFRPKTKLVWVEYPSRPFLDVVDISSCMSVCCSHDVLFLVDASLAPNLGENRNLSADIVVCKGNYLSGQGDMIGYLSGQEAYISRIENVLSILGVYPKNWDITNFIQTIETIRLRLGQQSNTALQVAKFLQHHRQIENVFYLGLSSHPDYSLVKKEWKNFGSVIVFRIASDKNQVENFCNSFEKCCLSTEWGAPFTTIEPLSAMSYLPLNSALKNQWNLGNVFQISIGLDSAEIIIQDLEKALAKIAI